MGCHHDASAVFVSEIFFPQFWIGVPVSTELKSSPLIKRTQNRRKSLHLTHVSELTYVPAPIIIVFCIYHSHPYTNMASHSHKGINAIFEWSAIEILESS